MENQMQSLSSRVDSILDRLSHRPLGFPDDTAVSATHSCQSCQSRPVVFADEGES
jgi:hypothetical protein